MKRKLFIFMFMFVLLVNIYAEQTVTLNDGSKAILYDDYTWVKVSKNINSNEDLVKKNKKYLRANIKASEKEIEFACAMYEQGWSYTMPSPKSAKAAWGVKDGRTTWYNGWWYNSKTKAYSSSTPKKAKTSLFLGDNQNTKNTWRNGGSPSTPDVYMYLLSKSGGPRY